jgi:hypothetical protein
MTPVEALTIAPSRIGRGFELFLAYIIAHPLELIVDFEASRIETKTEQRYLSILDHRMIKGNNCLIMENLDLIFERSDLRLKSLERERGSQDR